MDIGIVEYSGLVIFEVIMAALLSAYQPMNSKKRKLIYLMLAFMPFCFMTMFHSLEIGNDTGAYSNLFYSLEWTPFDSIWDNQRYEKGYLIFVWILSSIFSDSQWLFIITGFFICSSVFIWLYRYVSAPGLFMVLCVEMLTLDSWMNANRQVVALGILLIGFGFLLRKKTVMFFICTVIATSFHNAAFVFFVFYLCWYIVTKRISNRLNEKKLLFEMLILGVVITLGFSVLLNIVISIFPVYSYYLEGDYIDGSARIAVILKFIMGVIMILLPGILEHHNITLNKKNIVGIAFFICSLLSVLFTFISLQATIMMRLTGIFSLFLMGYYTESVAKLRVNKNRGIMTVLSIILFGIYGLIITIYRTPQWQTTYPFHFFFS